MVNVIWAFSWALRPVCGLVVAIVAIVMVVGGHWTHWWWFVICRGEYKKETLVVNKKKERKNLGPKHHLGLFLCGLLAWGTLLLSLSSNLIKKSSLPVSMGMGVGVGIGIQVAYP